MSLSGAVSARVVIGHGARTDGILVKLLLRVYGRACPARAPEKRFLADLLVDGRREKVASESPR